MSITICCTKRDFFSAADRWIAERPDFRDDLANFTGSLEVFMTKSWFSSLFMTVSGILLFDTGKFSQAYAQWRDECIEYDKNQGPIFAALERYMLEFISDDRFLIDSGLNFQSTEL